MDSTQPILAYYEETKWDYKHLWKSEETLAIHFGYWDELATSHAASVMRINAVLAQLMELRAGERVLDAGCGFGGSALWLASTIGCQVVGVNITPYQVAKARQSAHELGLADLVQFALSDFRRTGLRGASFDAVWALESVVHAEDKAEFVAEASRLLKTGGRLAIAEYLLRDDPPVVGDELAALRPWLQGWAMPSLLTEREYRTILEHNGFAEIRVMDITPEIAPSVARLGRITRRLLPIAPPLRALRLITAGQLNNARAAAAQVRALDKESWQYKVILARRAA